MLTSKCEDLDLIDLISERHNQLREWIEHEWNTSGNIPISNSEWFVLARVYKKMPTISQLAKQLNISRQAAHKLVKKLDIKGLVKVTTLENNRKDRFVQLTPLGESCYQMNEAYKARLEEKIAAAIGDAELETLKRVLAAEWGIKDKGRETLSTHA